ncbi:MAG: TetR family transcriptional regulator [Pseudopedobacter saltans]|uniref:TetR family transcriptional regulator n=1 Tax=Pseudopedobacter saltans TaxID=151895 RepID=A0A2W5EVY2_9SPHI|nr:MAG: TetR family transcriptional regulator [Pseudopedobacter saltans]
MSIQDRKQKHKESLKREILEAAKSLFLKDGFDATSIRKIAQKIDISPTTIYLYYKDKAEIAFSLHVEGFKKLSEFFIAINNIENPMERLKAMGKTYIQFALENQDYYELMFINKEPLCFVKENMQDGEWKEGENAFHALVSNIKACQLVGFFPKQDPYAMALMVWSTMHGMCSLQLHGHISFIAEDKEAFADFTLKDVINDIFKTFIQILESFK